MKDTWLRYMYSIYLEDEIRFVSKNIQSNSFVIEQENQINSQLNMFELIKENSQYCVSQEPEIQTTVKERLRYNTEMHLQKHRKRVEMISGCRCFKMH